TTGHEQHDFTHSRDRRWLLRTSKTHAGRDGARLAAGHLCDATGYTTTSRWTGQPQGTKKPRGCVLVATRSQLESDSQSNFSVLHKPVFADSTAIRTLQYSSGGSAPGTPAGTSSIT